MTFETPPLPLDRYEANKTAYQLRLAGFNYTDISRIMRLYHGVPRSAEKWRCQLRSQGAPPRHYANGKLRLAPHQKHSASRERIMG